MAQIPIGSTRQQEIVVSDDVAIRFIGLEAARVLSTPHLIMLLEMTCRNLLIDFLDPGHDSVGTIVEVRHLAATPIGMRVTARAEIVAVEGRRVDFKVEARDEREKVAEGRHQRFIVNVERFAHRLRDKVGQG